MTAFEMLNPFIDRMISALWTVILPCAPISVRLFWYHKHRLSEAMRQGRVEGERTETTDEECLVPAIGIKHR